MLGLLTNINMLIINPLWISHNFDAGALVCVTPEPIPVKENEYLWEK